MKYGRVVDLRQPSFSSPAQALSELRLRSAALLPQRPPLFLNEIFFWEKCTPMYVYCIMCACKGRQEVHIIDSLVSSFRSIELCERGGCVV